MNNNGNSKWYMYGQLVSMLVLSVLWHGKGLMTKASSLIHYIYHILTM
ncbi:hypothetical protein CLV42_101896 [Chitinophaga ginsengisoli]|uniref:Uncharacterized protein n=1 Tax=Chitinophaga ginsengisoli TaxID=363837 RepID=A0A2P8GQ93_9BACT|nr:hypothetical protein CLV42_101896 [Chitinophaga ginsengisoli]